MKLIIFSGILAGAIVGAAFSAWLGFGDWAFVPHYLAGAITALIVHPSSH